MLKDLKSGPVSLSISYQFITAIKILKCLDYLNLFFYVFQLETIGGEVIQIKLNEPSGVSIVRSSGEIRIKLGNVNTKFGLVHIIESVIVQSLVK